jgi:FMN phosphatase YigB (HAD superfamily)
MAPKISHQHWSLSSRTFEGQHMTMRRAVIFDYGFTISSEYYFNVPHPRIPEWNELIQRHVFSEEDFVRAWMKGLVGIPDIVAVLHDKTGEDPRSIRDHLRCGCRRLKENQAVIEFVRKLKQAEIPIALVTVNFDIFNEVIVPEHGYDALFDTIVNSCDYGETDKLKLWPIAFQELGRGLGYRNTLLIEDGKKEPDLFRDAGGQAIEYTGDAAFTAEISKFRIANKALHRTLKRG